MSLSTNTTTIDEYWKKEFTSSERLYFQKCCRTLLKKTFIVKDKDDENRKMYFFISKHSDFFSKYLNLMGFNVAVSKDSGTCMLQNFTGENDSAKLSVNRVQLKKTESIVLCALWTIFSDRIRSMSLDKVIKITLTDLRMELEKYDFKEQIEKGRMEAILSLFEKFNLIGTNGSLGDEHFTIVLYPSLQFALNEREFETFAKTAQERMLNKAGSDFEESVADAEEDASDDSDTREDFSVSNDIYAFDIEFEEGE